MFRTIALLTICICHALILWGTEKETLTDSLSIEITSDSVKCHGGNDGVIYVKLTNVKFPVSVRLRKASNNFTFDSQEITKDTLVKFMNLASLEYKIQIIENGIPSDQNILLPEPQKLSANQITILKYPESPEACNGIIKTNPTGGTPPYSYLWSENAGKSINTKVSKLCNGIYRCFITDKYSCVEVSSTAYLFKQSKN